MAERMIESNGVSTRRPRGSGRACRDSNLRGGITIRERWLARNEGRSFAYEGVGLPFVARARNEWTVQPEGDQTLLVSRAEIVLKAGALGRLLEPIAAQQLRRIGPRTIAAFKYLVEHGEPSAVKQRSCLEWRPPADGVTRLRTQSLDPSAAWAAGGIRSTEEDVADF